jgi:hypothetical protein
MGPSVIAYAVGRRIVEMRAASGRPRTLWAAAHTPRLVTVGGGRAYWVVRARRILAIAT